MSKCPPLGIMPEYIWKEKRLQDLSEAIERRIGSNERIPSRWVKEYNKLQEMHIKGRQ